jgi:hypothetical protein
MHKIGGWAHGVASRQLQFEISKRRKSPSNALRQIALRGPGSGESGPQNLSGLFLHGTSVKRGADPQPALDALVELSNGYGCHAFNDITDGNACTMTNLDNAGAGN